MKSRKKSPQQNVAQQGYVPNPSEWAVLADLRFFLASVVMISHLKNVVDRFNLILLYEDFGSLAAVVGFFTISGYSIAHSIDRRPKGFYVRRLWRIYPVYIVIWILCAIQYAIYTTIPEPNGSFIENPDVLQLVANAFMMQGILVTVFEANSPAWSLAIEEIFYALAPVFKRLRWYGLLVLIAGSGALYWTGIHPFGEHYARQLYGFSAGAFLWAWLLGFLYYYYPKSYLVQILVLAAPVYLIYRNNELGGDFSCFTVAGASLIVMYARYASLPPKVAKALVYLGDLSYPLYLVHVPVMGYIWMEFHTQNPLYYIVGDLAVSAILYHAVDRPMRGNWKIY